MKEKIGYALRFIIITGIMVLMVFLCVTEMFRIQIVDGESYAARAEVTYTAHQSIGAARGQILDVKGTKLNTNKSVYKVILQRAFCPSGQENKTLSETVKILLRGDEKWTDTIPISMTRPFEFTLPSDALDSFKEKLRMNYDATAENCLEYLCSEYNIDDSFSPQMKRYLAGIRYEMTARDYSYDNRYVIAEGVSLKSVIEMKERMSELPGIDITEETSRVYENGGLGAHIRGVISAISPEKYEKLKNSGYRLNDLIGTSGIELALESTLRGTDGEREIVRGRGNSALSDTVAKQVLPGNSVRLTIDAHFQSELERLLKNHLIWYQNNKINPRAGKSKAGSVVVLDVKTGGVLGMASYPTFDLNEYVDNYYSVLTGDDNPILNRAIYGEYRPGSTFKTITGTAGMMYGIINSSSTVFCGGTYMYYAPRFTPKCTGQHGNTAIRYALQMSCNIFFYDVGRRVGIERLDKVAEMFGIGTDLGLEIGGATGHMTTPEIYEKLVGVEYTPGNTIQAAIGQSETMVTPLHLAVQAMTLANKGVRYKPYLVDSVWNYDGTKMLEKNKPVIAEDFSDGHDALFETIHDGMQDVTKMITWPIGGGPNAFTGLPYPACVKTGTPQRTVSDFNSAFLGFYPKDDPVIAFGAMVEDADFSRYMIRNIIDAYFYDAYEPDIRDGSGIPYYPWKQWNAGGSTTASRYAEQTQANRTA